MSGSSPMNTFLSSNSYDSPQRRNSETEEAQIHPQNHPTPQQNSLQYAKDVSSLTNNLINLMPSQQTPVLTLLCPHDVVTTCVCCSQQRLEREEDAWEKNYKRLKHDSLKKAQSLEGSLGDFKENVAELQKRVADVTNPIKKTFQNWLENNIRKLCEINKYFLEDLKKYQERLFSEEEFQKDIACLEGRIKVLNGEFKDIKELEKAHAEEDLFRFKIKEKIKVIQRRSSSLIVPNLDDLSARLKDIVSIDGKTAKKAKQIKIPAFVDVKRYQAADMDASTMISSISRN